MRDFKNLFLISKNKLIKVDYGIYHWRLISPKKNYGYVTGLASVVHGSSVIVLLE